MAQVGQQIVNPRTGQRVLFLETAAGAGGERVRIESWNPPTGEDEPMHIHPRQESRAEVLTGSLRFVLNGQVRDVGPGESITIPAGTPHMFGNHGGEEAHSIQEFRPALRIAEFFEYLFDLAARGELDERGMPSLLELAVSAPVFADEIRVTSPPWPVQRAVFALLGPVARRRGLTGAAQPATPVGSRSGVMTGPRARFQAQLARQLGHPAGLAGQVVARGLDRGNKRLIAEVVKALEPSARARVADVGFGGGLGLELLLNAADDTVVHGVELSASMIRRAQTRFSDELSAGRLYLHAASVAQLPLGDASLDGAITVNTLYFVPDLDRAFAELARVLNGSGRLVIGVGDPDAMSKLAFTAHGFRLRAVDEISAALAAAGLTVIDHRRVDSRVPGHVLTAQLAS